MMTIDRAAAIAAALVYIFMAWSFVPSEYPRLLGGFALLICIVLVVAPKIRRNNVPGASIMAVAWVAAAVLVVPGFPAMGGHHYPESILVGFLGSQVVALTWTVLCWDPGPKAPNKGLRRILSFALMMAIVLSAIATIPILIIAFGDSAVGLTIALVYPAYFIGALLAGLAYWGLQSIQHHPAGRYSIACVAGLLVYSAMGPVVTITRHEPIDPLQILFIGTVAGCLVGPPVAFGWTQRRDAS